MKHSIRTKLILLILVTIVVPALILGGTSIYSTEKLTDEYAHQYVSLICEKKAAEINAIIVPLEQSVDYMSINALEEVSNPMNLLDPIYFENYMDKMRSILCNTSNSTESAIAVYLRLNPDIYDSKAGLFMTRERLGAEMQNSEITDLALYDESDTEYVGWYYQPVKAGKPIWMLPYYNQNIDVYMISYVVPLIKDNTTLGVLGMDINFDYITDKVKEIQVYNSGYAYITDADGNVIYHPDLNYGETVTQKNGWWYSDCELENGMVLNITAPINEINASRNELIRNMFISSILLTIIFIIITTLLTRKMTAPLKKLNQIAIEISEGNYDVDFDFERPNDEIGQLTKSFEHTVGILKEYRTYMNGLAYKDALTGVRNRTAFEHQVELIEESLENGEDVSVAVALFDVNNLKHVNDTLGHEKGDELIIGCCRLICRTFNHCAVFRIGGDEFVAIIKDTSDDHINQIIKVFNREMEETWTNIKPEQKLSIAYGVSRYDADKDNKKLEHAINRADEIMYVNKKDMKERMQKMK